MSENKRFTTMTNHYGTSRTYCTGIYDNQENKELTNTNQIINKLNKQNETIQRLEKENQAIQGKVFKLLDWLEKEKEVNRNEIKEWWNG